MSNYGFGGRLSRDFPSQVIVDVTEVCNLACIHCPHSEFKKTKHYDARMLDPELNSKMAKEVGREGKGITQYIRYTSNGEPLLHPRIEDMICDSVKYSGTTVTLTTNGTLLKTNKIESLLDTGIDLIDISIDAFKPETYSRIRVNGDLNSTVSNVLKLLNLREQSKKRTKVVVSFVEQAENTSETRDFEKYWYEKGADYVVIRPLHSAAGAKSMIAENMNNQAQNRYPCIYPWERIVLNAQGYLSFCPASWTGESELINYAVTSIKTTWKSNSYKELRNQHLINDFTKNKFCGNCPDWMHIRWPEEGKSYADMVKEFQKDQA